ncbi:hypothetical protein BDQ17DRAFT_587142 [Cyathus striatus]|nr:hypothetical protein BDQ17DRAFT_587142 [Cyathus striatus]
MLGRLLSTAQWYFKPQQPSLIRLFASSSVAEAGYKMKSHSGAKKRWKSIANSFKRAHAGHSHKNVTKSPAQKNRLSATAYATPAQRVLLKKKLLPYGSN